MIVSNTTPIINFGKQGEMGILRKCFTRIIIPRGVYYEIIEKKDSPEAVALDKAVEESWIVIEDIEVDSLLKTQNIGKGEKEAISLAKKKGMPLLVDDDFAKSYASVLEVEAHGSFYVLYFAYIKKIIDKNKARDIFEKMIRNGFYVSTELYSKFFELLEKED